MSREFTHKDIATMGHYASTAMLANAHTGDDRPVSGGHGAVLKRSSFIRARDLDGQLLGLGPESLDALAKTYGIPVQELRDRQLVLDQVIQREFTETGL